MPKQLNVSLAVTANTGQAKAQLQQLQNTLQQLVSNSASLRLDINSDEIQKASQEALQLAAHLREATSVDTGTLDFAKLNTSLQSSGKTLEQYGQSLLNLGPKGKQAFMELANSVSQSEIPIKRLSNLLGNFGTVLSNTVRWQLSSSMIHGFMGAIQGAYRYAQDLNQSLSRIQIVTQLSDNEMAKFAESANKAAKSLSTTTTSYTDAALIYYQQGIRDEKEITERTNATIKMANVTGQSAQQVSDQMTAIWNNFATGGENLEYYADVITALGAATASSSTEISKGLEKFAAIADTVGLSYENATAALATITATTRQSADTVGTGLRTLFSRLQSLSLGETLEDGVDLTKYSKALRTVGIDVLDASGNLRDMDSILDDMGNKWQDLSDAQKTALAQTVGGVRQYTTLIALMDNFDFYKQNVNVAKNAEGTLDAQQATFEKSWGAALKRVKASAETIFSSLIDDQFFIKLTDGFAKLLDSLNSFISGLGGVKGLMLTLGSIAQLTFGKQITSSLYKVGTTIKSLFPGAEAKRTSFLNNAAAMMAGYPSGTKLTDAMINAMPEEQRAQVTGLRDYLSYQQAYRNNVDYMSPEQRTAAQMTLDNYYNAINQQRNIYDQIRQTHQITNDTQSIASREAQSWHRAQYDKAERIINKQNRGDELTATEQSLLRNQYSKYVNTDAAGKFSMKVDRTEAFDLTEATNLQKTFTQYEEEVAQHTKNMAELHKQAEGQEGEDRVATEKLIEEEQAKWVSKTQAEFVEKWQQAGVSEGTINKYLTNSANEAAAKQAKEDMKVEVESKRKAAEEASKQKNTGMAIATGVQQLGMGITSSLAVSSALEGWQNSIESYNEGAITAGELTKSLVGSFGSIATNGAMAFSGMTKAVKSFSTALGLAGKSAGWIGAVLTAITIAVPFIIDGIDSLIETQDEKLERLDSYVQDSQTALSDAKKRYQEIFTDFNGHNALLDELNSLTAGTYAFKAALNDANSAAEELITKYKLSPADYYTDSKGAIHFMSTAQEKAETMREAEIAQAQYDLHLNQFTSQFAHDLTAETAGFESLQFLAANGLTKDSRFLEYLEPGETLGEYFWNESQYLKAGPYAGVHKENLRTLAKNYGYDSPEALLNAYAQNPDTVRNVRPSNEATNLLRTVLSDYYEKDDGKISDTDKLKINAITDNFTLDQLQLTSTEVGGIDLKTEDKNKNQLTNRLESFQQYLTKLVTEGQLTEDESSNILNNLLSSSIWTEKNVSIGRKSREINRIVSQLETQKQLQNIIDQNSALYDSIDIEKYSDLSSMSGKDIQTAYKKSIKPDDDTPTWLADEWFAQQNIERALFEQAIKQQAESVAGLQQTLLAQTNLGLTQEQLVGMGEVFSSDQLQTLSNYTKMFGQYFGKDVAGEIFNQLVLEMYDGGSDLLDALDSIDWTDSDIGNLFTLKHTIEETKRNQGNLVSTLSGVYEAVKEEAGGDSGLFEELYGSDAFADTLTDLQNTFKETGEIGASSIMSAAESCELLSQFLEITDVNAQGLADIFEAINDTSLNLDTSQVTDGLMQAFSAAGALKDNLAKVYEHIDNFNLDRSISDIGSHYKNMVDQIESSQSKMMLGDPALLSAWKELLGSESLKQYMEWGIQATSGTWTPEQISEDFNEKFGDIIEMFQSIQETGSLTGVWRYQLNNRKENDKTNGLMHYNEETGQVVIDDNEKFAEQFQSQQSFIDYLTKDRGVSENMARAMTAEVVSTNFDLNKRWGIEAAQEGFEALQASVQSGSDISLTALEALYNQYQEFYGDKDFDAFVERFKQGMGEAAGSVYDLGDDFKYAEANYDELRKRMGDQPGEDGLDAYLDKHASRRSLEHNDKGDIIGSTKDANGQWRDINELQKAYEALGFTTAQANQLIDKSGQQLIGTYKTATEGIKTFDKTDSEYLDWVEKTYGDRKHSAERMAEYASEMSKTEQTKVNADIYAEALANELAGIEITPEVSESSLTSFTSYIEQLRALGKDADIEITTHYGSPGDLPTGTAGTHPASGYNNAHGFAGGKHINGQYQGLAEVGELGPELWIHDGQPYLAGIHGRTKAYIHSNDQIFTAAQTKEILADNPSLQDIPGFSVGYGNTGITWNKEETNATSSNVKDADWEPERYHLITRQIKDLEREYDRLDKIKERAYGTAKLDAINNEIDATDKLIEAQQRLIDETIDYDAIDTERLKKLLAPDEFVLDEYGNLANFEDLQQKYKKAADTKKDKNAQEVWAALTQYEETLDKFHEENDKLQELIYQQVDLRLEAITTKIDLQIEINDDALKYLDYLIEKLEDNSYRAAEAIVLLGDKTAETMDKIENYQSGLLDILKEHGIDSIDQLNQMTTQDLLDKNFTDEDIQNIKNYNQELLEANKDLLEIRETIIERVINAFDDLNERVQKSYEKFDNYNTILDNYRNLSELMTRSLGKQSKQLMNQLSDATLANTQKQITAARQIFDSATQAAIEAETAYNIAVASGDEQAQLKWQEIMDSTSEKLKEAKQQFLEAWQNGLTTAKEIFENTMEDISNTYDATLGGIFGSLEYLQEAYDRHKETTEVWLQDFERLHELSKLSRDISGAIDDTDSIRAKRRLRDLQAEINKLQQDSNKLSQYDIDALNKKFELEKARLALDEAKNAKSQVRLQRDANGNWGYVYTADEDEVAKAEQEYEDKLYEYQKLNHDYIQQLQEDMVDAEKSFYDELTNIWNDPDLSEEQRNARLASLFADQATMAAMFDNQFGNVFDNQSDLMDIMLELYKDTSAEVVDTWQETSLAIFTNTEAQKNAIENWTNAFKEANEAMKNTNKDSIKNINDTNEAAGVTTENFGDVALNTITQIGTLSEETVTEVQSLADTMNDELVSALGAAVEWEIEYTNQMQNMIGANENFVISINDMVRALGGEESKGLRYSNLTAMTNASTNYATTLDNIVNDNYENKLAEYQRLNAEYIAREIAQWQKMIEANAFAQSFGLGDISSQSISVLPNVIDQNVNITASFPNATNHAEIEEAFQNLVNKASQYANRKGQ